MEHSYILTDGELKILTPGVDKTTPVKHEIIEVSPGRNILRSTYPNGFVIEYDQQPGVIVFACNMPLTRNEDGTYTAPTDK